MTQPISIGFLPTPSHPTAASSSLDQGFRRFPALIDALKELSQGLKIECMEMWTSFLKPAKSCLKTLQNPHLESKTGNLQQYSSTTLKDLKPFHFKAHRICSSSIILGSTFKKKKIFTRFSLTCLVSDAPGA